MPPTPPNSIDWESYAKEIEELKSKSEEHLAREIFCKDGAQLSREDYEYIYTLGCECYHRQEYDKSEVLFRGLCFLKPLENKYWWGLSYSLKLQGKYERAIETYNFLLSLEEKRQAEVYFHMAECNLDLCQLEEAQKGIREAKKHLMECTEPSIRKKILNLAQLLKQ